jgi:hypothetical protein
VGSEHGCGARKAGDCGREGARKSNWSGATPSAHIVGGRFFPLDEALELLPGQLTPQLQEQVVRLGSWLPFQPAAQLFEAFTGVAISAATVRRLTETAGRMQVEQQEAAVVAMEAGQMVVPESVPQKMVYAVDGAMVPLVGGEWAEVRTLAIGEAGVQERAEGDSEAMTQHLSYFSRLLDADSFARAALVETERRGLHQAQQAAAVGDGAEWVRASATIIVLTPCVSSTSRMPPNASQPSSRLARSGEWHWGRIGPPSNARA